MNPRRIVLVKWWDAQSEHSGWKPIDKVRGNKPPLMQSVGWIVADQKGHVTLVASQGGGDCDGDVTIPRGMIKEIVDLCPKR